MTKRKNGNNSDCASASQSQPSTKRTRSTTNTGFCAVAPVPASTTSRVSRRVTTIVPHCGRLQGTHKLHSRSQTPADPPTSDIGAISSCADNHLDTTGMDVAFNALNFDAKSVVEGNSFASSYPKKLRNNNTQVSNVATIFLLNAQGTIYR